MSANSDSVKSKQFAKTADNPYKVLDVFEDDEKREFEIVDFMDRINNSGTYTELRKEPLFELIAGDLVYVPTEEEMNQKDVVISQLNKDRIYKFISTNPTAVQGKPDVNFMPHRFASLIFSDSKSNSFQLKMKVPGASKSVLQGELSITRADSRIKVAMPNIIGGACTQMPVIRDVCWKLEVDRLGNIINIIR